MWQWAQSSSAALRLIAVFLIGMYHSNREPMLSFSPYLLHVSMERDCWCSENWVDGLWWLNKGDWSWKTTDFQYDIDKETVFTVNWLWHGCHLIYLIRSVCDTNIIVQCVSCFWLRKQRKKSHIRLWIHRWYLLVGSDNCWCWSFHGVCWV